MGKQVELKCVAEPKEFKNEETGEVIQYVQVGVIVNDQFIKLSVPRDSKQLFNYLTKDMFK